MASCAPSITSSQICTFLNQDIYHYEFLLMIPHKVEKNNVPDIWGL